MPPFTCPSFEEIEAKEWASDTLKHILTEVTPMVLETSIKENYVDNERGFNSKSHLKRSLSFLEAGLLGLRSEQRQQQQQAKWTRRSHSTILPNTTNTPSDKQLQQCVSPHQPMFQCRLRNNWYNMDRAVSFKNTFQGLFNSHNKPSKEQEGYAIWKYKISEYSIHPPWSTKDFNEKSYSKSSTQLSKFIMSELLTTEETYLSHLLAIKNFYMDPLVHAASEMSFLVNMKNIEIIFAYVPEMIMLSDLLVKHLRNTISSYYLDDETKRNQVIIGKLFCEFEPYFEIYIAYAANFSKSRKYLAKASSNITYHQLIQDTMRKKDANRMLLSDYMIAPIQRITRYCLLFTDLLKHLHKSHPDYIYLDKVLRFLSALAFAMNTVHLNDLISHAYIQQIKSNTYPCITNIT